MAMMSEEHKEKTVQHAKRFGGWWVASVVLIAVIGAVASQQIAVLAYKVAQVCLGLLLAYVADRSLFHHAPDISNDMPAGPLGGARIIARAIVALAVIVGLTIGL